MEAAAYEANMEALLNNAERELVQRHPIVYDSYNLCELASQKKLNKFSLPVLNSICSCFGINTEDIKSKRRKKPFIERLQSVCQECECNQWSSWTSWPVIAVPCYPTNQKNAKYTSIGSCRFSETCNNRKGNKKPAKPVTESRKYHKIRSDRFILLFYCILAIILSSIFHGYMHVQSMKSHWHAFRDRLNEESLRSVLRMCHM